MKKIEAIVLEEQVDAIKQSLEAAGYVGMTVFPVKGRGSEGGIDLRWRATTYTVDFLPKVLVMIVVNEDVLNHVISLIVRSCQAPEFDPDPDHRSEHAQSWGKIFVSPVEQAISIRTALQRR
ncbi:MAG: P-II family nitrogen regulator [Cyanobacteria bacterium HKST-UBA06]|nr:P-II family nitrogen regulator [Cyanobacteria bacterium HKST-UBA05]MCA9799453.1 P-II family nitrogen regulator [Cyanobacteria bacterium HKST-UBA04]MCA9806695.1 P-II family nitrogen regulator [Cyanobacteria bacterium HKST-UBA06]MCA9841404.1 P-II family nitrogen regulator [Cyanobacteria bacterium HKST-UBA03]